jgi:Caspase domain
MGNPATAISRYAILIGINSYPKKPLSFCVRDVQSINEYLGGTSGDASIQMLVANEDSVTTDNGCENPWPSLRNVFTAFNNVLSAGLKTGDHIYIHFSGHGRRRGSDREFSNRSTGDLALVLLSDKKPPEEEDLLGSILADRLEQFVKQGAVVTLVLDCCFSAAVYRRDDANVRFLPPNGQPISDCGVSGVEKREDLVSSGSQYRTGTMRPSWLLDPKTYAILSASGPQDAAYELIFKPKRECGPGDAEESGQGYGSLTYFLLLALESNQPGQNIKILYDHVRAGFAKARAVQHPVLYGNTKQAFFGQKVLRAHCATVPFFKKHDGTLELQAGRAHAVCDGDQFILTELRPLLPGTLSSIKQTVVQVIRASAFTSEVELLGADTNHRFDTGLAKSLKLRQLQKYPICLGKDLSNLEDWRTKLCEKSLSVIDDENAPYSFYITKGGNNTYEVMNGTSYSKRISNIPPLLIDGNGLTFVCDVIEHLAKFELIRALNNQAASEQFGHSFDVKLVDRSGKSYQPGSVVEVQANDELKYMFELRIVNTGDKVLYVHPYDMGPHWEIENLLKATYEAVPPMHYMNRNFKGEFMKKIKTSITDDLKGQGQQYSEDIFKIFITSHPTSFEFLELPPLNGESEEEAKESPSRVGGEQVREDWIALDFYVRTRPM